MPIPLIPPPPSRIILFSSWTMRMTLRRPQPVSSSLVLLPQPRLVGPAGTRTRLARRLPLLQQQQRKHRDQGLRGRWRHLHPLTPPLTWEQPLQHPVSTGLLPILSTPRVFPTITQLRRTSPFGQHLRFKTNYIIGLNDSDLMIVVGPQ